MSNTKKGLKLNAYKLVSLRTYLNKIKIQFKLNINNNLKIKSVLLHILI